MEVENNVSARDCRSALYMPASNTRAIAKGPNIDADAIILDLEDSVGPAEKVMARDQAIEAFTTLDYGYRLKALRINAVGSPWHEDDLNAALKAQPDVVVLPKAETAEEVNTVIDALRHAGMEPTLQIWAMMETPKAVLNAQQIATDSNDQLSALLIGNNDLAKAADMPVTSDRTYLLPWIMQLVAVAKAHSLALLDGVYNRFSDTLGFTAECKQAVAMGMNGKTLIHPSQVAVANTLFSPSESDIANAAAIVEAFSNPDNQNAGVIQVAGQMVERLHLDMAEALLERVQRIHQRS